MTLRTFVLIIIAVSLWVSRGIKIHEDPHTLPNTLKIIWSVIKFILKLCLILIAIVLGISVIQYFIKYHKFPTRVEEGLGLIIQIIAWIIFIWAIVVILFLLWMFIRNYRLQFKKNNVKDCLIKDKNTPQKRKSSKKSGS